MKIAVEGIAYSGAHELSCKLAARLGWDQPVTLADDAIVRTFIEATNECFV